jgi:plasmid stability protein
MPIKKTKPVFIGVSGIPADVAHQLRHRARANNRSVSGEIRNIIEDALAELSGAAIAAPTNTEQTKTWTTSQS